MLRLADHWVWDSWIADDGERYHLYHLRAPRALGDPSLRHTHARVGHAVSTDLVEWTDLGEVLGPSDHGWDDLAVWTGSVVQDDDGQWRMFYTAISTRGHGVRDQRIGVVVSDDLHDWRRPADRPVIELDRHRYRTLDEDPSASETWRDPFVFRDPDGLGWHMLITARDPHSQTNENGVLAHAVSSDLTTWELGPPVCGPGRFGQIEVPQVRVLDGQPVLVFTCHPDEQSMQQREQFGEFCTWAIPGESVLGPWDVDLARPFRAEPSLFAAPLVQRRNGVWCLLGFRNREPEGIFEFDIVDPIDVTFERGELGKA